MVFVGAGLISWRVEFEWPTVVVVESDPDDWCVVLVLALVPLLPVCSLWSALLLLVDDWVPLALVFSVVVLTPVVLLALVPLPVVVLVPLDEPEAVVLLAEVELELPFSE